MSGMRVDSDSFSKAVVGILDDYGENVAAEVRKAVDVTAKELVSETKRTAPRKAIGGRPAGTYANHISSKVGRDTPLVYSKVWYGASFRIPADASARQRARPSAGRESVRRPVPR